jgi:mannose-6-phosphate isomerase-like protein (cupin superfamily)
MTDSHDFLKDIDKSAFMTKPYQRRVEKPWGYELHLAADDAPYMMKIIHINEGARLSLQAHDQKTETWTVLKGQAGVIIENADGELVKIGLEPGQGYTSQIGQRHRLVGITDCDVVEASTQEIGVTLRLEDDYSRSDETEEMRAQPNRGWST